MSTTVSDKSLAEQLRQCKEMTTLCDADGNVVGFFEPPQRIYEDGEIPDFDEDELDRREARWQGIPSTEVRRRLKELR